jgi:hypothetical protein
MSHNTNITSYATENKMYQSKIAKLEYENSQLSQKAVCQICTMRVN